MRVLTVFLAITMVGIYVLLGRLGELEEFVATSRQQRTAYQAEEKVRQCTILSLLGSSQAEMRKLRC